MTGNGPELLFYALALVLPLSALLARRIPFASALKMAAAWLAIFAVGIIAVSQREAIGGVFDRARRTLVGNDQKINGRTVRITMAPDGHFYASVSLNGTQRRMLIDSGASITALSRTTANAAGITSTTPFKVGIQTANGQVFAERATVARFELETITARDLPVVIADAFGNTDVIGMNFLSRLRGWRVEGRTLILDPEQS